MSQAKGEKAILELASRSTGTLLHAYHVASGSVPVWDAVDDAGRPVVLVGKAPLEATPAGAEYVEAAVAALKAGEMLEGVGSIEFLSQASALIGTAAYSPASDAVGRTLEVLADGGRQGGKTIAFIALLGILGEQRRHAGFRDPLKVMWAQDTLKSCREKTSASFEEPLWGGAWTLRANREEAVLTLGGVELVHVHFVGAADAASAEALRAASHVLVVDEAVPTLESGGVTARQYEIALSSLLRLPSHRRVAIVGTNPGGPESWLYARWLAADHRPECVRVPVDNRERLTGAEWQALQETFHSPDLQARLGRGDWVDLLLGPAVAVGFNAAVHVSPAPLEIAVGADIYCGWDSGPSALHHAVVIGQRLGGKVGLTLVRVYACLVGEQTGLKQHLESQILPWFGRRCAWILGRGGGERILNFYDPNCDTAEGGDYDMNPVARIRAALGGSFIPGAVDLPARLGPMLALFQQGDGRGTPALQICPGPDARPLVRALAVGWDLETTRGGAVVRDQPRKPNHPHEDAGDAFCYFVGGIAPSRPPRPVRPPGGKPSPSRRDFDLRDYSDSFGGRRRG